MRELVIALSSLLLFSCGEGGADSGGADIELRFAEADRCPSIASAVAAPTETSVGGLVGVSATASDADLGDSVSFSWDPPANFANPSSATTTYRCTVSGRQTLTLLIADSTRPAPCVTKAKLEIACISGDSAGP